MIRRVLNALGWYEWTLQGSPQTVGLAMFPGHNHSYGVRRWLRVKP